MAVATAAFAPSPPPTPMDAAAKPKFRTRAPPARLNLNVAVGAHNLRILKKAPSANNSDTPRSTASAPTPTTNANNSKQRKYERKSKRFIWPDELHRLFVAAIFDVGLKNASPKALLAIMLGAGVTTELTTEHLKSHLQKYRLNYERSRLEFLEFYDESARRSHKRQRKSAGDATFVFPISHKRKREEEEEEDEEEDADSSYTEDNACYSEAAASEMDADTTAPPRDVLVRAQKPQLARAVVKPEMRTNATPVTATTNHADALAQRKPPTNHANPSLVSTLQQTPTARRQQVIKAPPPPPVPKPPMATTTSYPALTALNDPQWSILNSLISPQLVAVNDSAEVATQQPAPIEPLSLNTVEPADLQVQMHLAMQAQMNLHRQMLTRKVEVSQHLLPQPAISSAPPSSTVFATSTTTSSTTSLPSQGLNTNASNRMLPTVATTDVPATADPTARLAFFNGALTDTNPPSVDAGSLLDAADFGLSSFDAIAAATAPADRLDAADLVQWDKMDFTMELDDDDLFGFLKA